MIRNFEDALTTAIAQHDAFTITAILGPRAYTGAIAPFEPGHQIVSILPLSDMAEPIHLRLDAIDALIIHAD